MNHAFFAGEEFNESTEGLDARDLASVDLADFGVFSQAANFFGSRYRSAIDTGDINGTVFFNVDLRAGCSLYS